MIGRIFECTPEYFAGDHDNPHLDDTFPVDANYWERSSRKAHAYLVVSLTVYQVYHKVALWPHIFTCLTLEPADSQASADTDFFARDLTQIALHRFQNKDVVFGSFVPDAVVLGTKRTLKRPTAIESVHFTKGVRLTAILDLFQGFDNPGDRFAKYTKNCIWLTGSILWKVLARQEHYLRIPSRMSYTEFVTQKMAPLRRHEMMPWLQWKASSFWRSHKAAWMFEPPLSEEERKRNRRNLVAALQRQQRMKEASLSKLKDEIDRLRGDRDDDDEQK